MISELLRLAAVLLLALVWNVLMFILSGLLLLSGPIIYVVARNAMSSRLDCERPAPPGWLESWRWSRRWASMPQIYFRTYGPDTNLALALTGVVATILTFYLFGPILTILDNLTKALGLGMNF